MRTSKCLCCGVVSSSVAHSRSLFLFRIQRRTRSGGYISETCPIPSPLCWCCSPQPTTLMVHNQSHDQSAICLLLSLWWNCHFNMSSVPSQWWSLPTPSTEPTPFSLLPSVSLVSSQHIIVIAVIADYCVDVKVMKCLVSLQEPTVWWTYWLPSSITSSEDIYWWVSRTAPHHAVVTCSGSWKRPIVSTLLSTHAWVLFVSTGRHH